MVHILQMVFSYERNIQSFVFQPGIWQIILFSSIETGDDNDEFEGEDYTLDNQ